MNNPAIQADEYRERARDAAQAGASSPLIEVRRKHERAASVWTALADAAGMRAVERAKRYAHAKAADEALAAQAAEARDAQSETMPTS